jgi:hypothetical protein
LNSTIPRISILESKFKVGQTEMETLEMQMAGFGKKFVELRTGLEALKNFDTGSIGNNAAFNSIHLTRISTVGIII